MSKKNLNIADLKRLEVNTDSISSYVRKTDKFSGLANIVDISKFPGNEICADCRSDDNEWVSLEVGAFLCINCASVHKTLGGNFKKIQSMKHDVVMWELEQIQFLESSGNNKVNEIYEARLPSYYLTPKEIRDSLMVRNNFIKAKYVEKMFIKKEENDEMNSKAEFPFVTLPQPIIVHQDVLFQSPSQKKPKPMTLFLLNAFLSFYKNDKSKTPFSIIPLSGISCQIKKTTVKGLEAYLIFIYEKNSVFNQNYTENNSKINEKKTEKNAKIDEKNGKKSKNNKKTNEKTKKGFENGELAILQVNGGESVVQLVNAIRVASAFYEANPREVLRNASQESQSFERGVIDGSEAKASLRFCGKKKFLALIDHDLFVFKSAKTTRCEEVVLLREANILVEEHGEKSKKPVVEIRGVFGWFKLQFGDEAECNEWEGKLRGKIESLRKEFCVNFRDEIVYRV